MKMCGRLNKKFGITTVLITFVSVMAVISTVTVVLLSKKYSEAALHNLADDVISRSVTDTAAHVNSVLKPALSCLGSTESMVPDDMTLPADIKQSKDMAVAMIKLLENYTDVYTTYYCNTNGEFFLVGKRQKFAGDKKLYYFNKVIRVRNGVRTVIETWYNGTQELETNILPDDTYDPRKRPWYDQAMKKGTGTWSSPYIFFITKLPGITYSKPVYKDGKLMGVLASDLEINTISDFMMSAGFTKNTKMFVLDENDNILAHSGMSNYYSSSDELKNKIPTVSDFGDRVLKQISNKMDRDHLGRINDVYDGRQMFKTIIVPFDICGLNSYIGLYTPESDYLEPYRKNYRAMLVIIFVVLIFMVYISVLIAKELAKPFIQLSSATSMAKNLKFDNHIDICTNFREVSETQQHFNDMLESLSNYKNANELFSESLQTAHIDTLYRLAAAAEHKDLCTYNHLKRVSDISVMIGELLNLSEHDIEQLRHSSVLHDVGKLGVPDNILMKPGKLNTEEFDIIKKHPDMGAKILEKPSSEIMKNALVIARSHHEKWDGTGYPNGLSGEAIPLFGRIVALADVIDALISKRPYKEAFPFEQMVQIVIAEKGKHFDPHLAELVLANLDRLRKIVED